MELLQQFQGVLGSLLLGGCFCFGFTFFKTFLNHKYLKIIWIPFQICYCLLAAYLYYLFLCVFTYGIYNFFFTLSLILGMIIYVKFYYPKLNVLFAPINEKIEKKLKKIKVIKIKRKKKNEQEVSLEKN